MVAESTEDNIILPLKTVLQVTNIIIEPNLKLFILLFIYFTLFERDRKRGRERGRERNHPPADSLPSAFWG